jgi:hypothetical protein
MPVTRCEWPRKTTTVTPDTRSPCFVTSVSLSTVIVAANAQLRLRPEAAAAGGLNETAQGANARGSSSLSLSALTRETPGWFVTRIHLQLCELSRFFTGQERNQSFKSSCRFVRMVGLFQHQMFEFPD